MSILDGFSQEQRDRYFEYVKDRDSVADLRKKDRSDAIAFLIEGKAPVDSISNVEWNFDRFESRALQASGKLEGTRWGEVKWSVIVDRFNKSAYLMVIKIPSEDNPFLEEDRFHDLADGLRFLQWVTNFRGSQFVSEEMQYAVEIWKEDLA